MGSAVIEKNRNQIEIANKIRKTMTRKLMKDQWWEKRRKVRKRINFQQKNIHQRTFFPKKYPLTYVYPPKKVLATQSYIKSQLQPQVSGFKLTANLSAMPFNKTEREQGHEQRDHLLHELGDLSAIISSDQVVCKLISNLRLEQQRFADALLRRSRMSAMNKMKNYLDHLAQKNEQTLFKLKQTAIDRSLSKLQGNKQTVRSGYTQKMRQAIQNGLRRRQSKQP